MKVKELLKIIVENVIKDIPIPIKIDLERIFKFPCISVSIFDKHKNQYIHGLFINYHSKQEVCINAHGLLEHYYGEPQYDFSTKDGLNKFKENLKKILIHEAKNS